MGYRKIALTGIGWLGLLRIFARLITLLKIAILARLLLPLEFGRFGIAALALALFETLTETGVNQALIHSNKPVHEVVNSAWIIAICRGIIISILIALSAYPLAIFFHDRSVISLILLIAVVPLIKGFINPMTVVFIKELQFSREFIFRSILLLIDFLTALIAAILTRNAMAFVIALLVSGLFEVILSFIWFNIRPQLKFQIDHLKEILHYGKWITLAGIAFWFSDQMDNLFTGRIFGTSVLGIYQTAFKISTLPVTEIAGTVNQVAFPMLSKVKYENNRLKKIFKLSFGFSTLIGLILASVLLFFPELIVRVLLGNQWLTAVPIVRILAIYGVIRTIESSLQPLFLAVGKPEVASYGNIIKAAVLFVALLFLANRGLSWIAVSVVFSGVAIIPYYLWQLVRRESQ